MKKSPFLLIYTEKGGVGGKISLIRQRPPLTSSSSNTDTKEFLLDTLKMKSPTYDSLLLFSSLTSLLFGVR